jgi:glycosyltransferase involved in cell wall biosynthesis
MKVLHVTNEFTKKNFSISSLIIYLSGYLYENYKHSYSILTSSLEKNLFEKKNIEILNISSWLQYFFSKNVLSKKFMEFDHIHIHGLWAPIQFISLLVCNEKNIKCVVHPHGMLLDEAVKSAGLIKYIFKQIGLLFLKNILGKNIHFVSITGQETKAIEKYFPNSKITEISNPIPFSFKDIDENNKKKKLVYFGRIHPHKNLHLVIKSFIKANLPKDWTLELYGIRDDENYFIELNNLIADHSQIRIMEPIFGEKKQQIMKEAWLNILVSKSEVLSLSILESCLYGLPSLVNKDIEINDFGDSIIFTDLSTKNISKKIIEITSWTLEQRKAKEQSVISSVIDKTSIKVISQKYENMYYDIAQDVRYLENLETVPSNLDNEEVQLPFISVLKKNLNFLLISSAYTFNLMFGSLLVVSLVILGYYSIAGELGLVISFWITITQIFSSNMRSIVVSEQKTNYATYSLIYRFFFSICSLVIFYFISHEFLTFENQNLIFLSSALIMSQWVNEMKLVQFEVNKTYKKFNIFLYINVFTIFCTAIILILNKLTFLEYLLGGYSLAIVIYLIKDVLFYFFGGIKATFKTIIKINIQTIAFASSFSIIISSFAWRIMIYYIFDKSLAGIFFACFSIGSFPGTLFNSVIGPAFIKQKIEISNTIKKLSAVLFVIILFAITVTVYKLILQENINYIGIEFVSFTIAISLVGSYFMSFAMYLRHKKIQTSEKERMYIFKRDILYGLSITFLIPILYYSGGTVAVSFSFFLASIMAMISYSLNFINSAKLNH